MTTRQAIVLVAVASTDAPLSQTDIVAFTGIDRSTIADIVRRLVNQSLLARERTKEDARAYAVTLTARGKELTKALSTAFDESNLAILGAIAKSDQDRFLRSLKAIVEATGPISSARVRERPRRPSQS